MRQVTHAPNHNMLQVQADELKDRGTWASGWLQRAQLDALETKGAECKACRGSGLVSLPKLIELLRIKGLPQ